MFVALFCGRPAGAVFLGSSVPGGAAFLGSPCSWRAVFLGSSVPGHRHPLPVVPTGAHLGFPKPESIPHSPSSQSCAVSENLSSQCYSMSSGSRLVPGSTSTVKTLPLPIKSFLNVPDSKK